MGIGRNQARLREIRMRLAEQEMEDLEQISREHKLLQKTEEFESLSEGMMADGVRVSNCGRKKLSLDPEYD